MNAGRPQKGLILASGLVLLATGMLTMSTVMGVAVRELSRVQAIESLEQARAAAAIGLHQALTDLELRNTIETELANGALADGSRWRVSVSFVGAVPRSPEPGLWDWHFLLHAQAHTPGGAEVYERLQLGLPAPPPTDLDMCLDSGCPVPPLCGPPDPGCPEELRAAPQAVAWHLPEDRP